MTDKKPLSSFLAGIAGGSASTILLYPLDLVKVRLQVDESSMRQQQHHHQEQQPPHQKHHSAQPTQQTQQPLLKQTNHAKSATINTASNTASSASSTMKHTKTIYGTIRGVLRNEGYAGLYRGLTTAIIGSAMSWGGFFILYEEIKGQMVQYKIQELETNLPIFGKEKVVVVIAEGGKGYDLSKDMHVDEEIDINTNVTNYNTKQRNQRGMLETQKEHEQPQHPKMIQQPQVKLGPMEHFSASCLAGACMVVLTNPLWLIKTRLQLQNSRLQSQLTSNSSSLQIPQTMKGVTTQIASTQNLKPPYRGLLHAAYTIVKEEGVLALYKGSLPALMLVSHGGIQFVAYEFLKGHFAPKRNNTINNNNNNSGDKTNNDWNKQSGKNKGTIAQRMRDSLGYLVMGAASKFIASTTTYPLQVIKARLQQRSQVVELSETTGEIIITKREYAGVADCVGKIWRNEGFNGFFKGCVTNALRVAPSAAITFVVYEWVLDVLN